MQILCFHKRDFAIIHVKKLKEFMRRPKDKKTDYFALYDSSARDTDLNNRSKLNIYKKNNDIPRNLHEDAVPVVELTPEQRKRREQIEIIKSEIENTYLVANHTTIADEDIKTKLRKEEIILCKKILSKEINSLLSD